MARRRDPDETQGFDALRAAHEDGPEPAADPAVVRSRRRFARRQWARRWLTWKPLLAVVLLLALAAGGLWLVYFSSYLSVQGVSVVGEDQLTAAEVERAAAVPTGEPLATADLDRIRTRVEALAPVRSADVTRKWPDEVLITLTERQAVAVVSIGGKLRGLDEEGVDFRDFAQAPPDLPRIESAADTGTEALREGALVVAALPGDLAAKVDHVDVETVDEIALALRDGREVVWGSAAESDVKAAVLADLLAVAPDAQRYDVSVPGQPTTRAQ
ncbi:FtsQ-type POTRA domain-containing protein [Nocardioides sp. YIM 152315]|uniref:cell division protein FtsQ/DivIB n=1 Tax=Nocardioides sp. YIM 152315 TaxID=3031760 RepID=UPI0023D9A5AA|nr:FtsQ-type POTRA domain-containing protein [Nocardioides sp. YIM 152315]MDF1603075.1 FtsQ-type POTRA domain-containing protein [Nocardioides sp. YIM 152315]